MGNLSKYRVYIGIGGCVLAAVGCFLPWISSLGISINFIAGDGKIILILAIVSAVLICLKKDKISLISSIIAAAIYLMDAYNSFKSHVNLDIGFFVILIGLIGMITYPFIKEKN